MQFSATKNHHTKRRTARVFGAASVLIGIICQISLMPSAFADDDRYAMAKRWWNTLNGPQMEAALFGDMATDEQSAAAHKMYDELDDETRMLVHEATEEIYGMGGHYSVGAWWETLDCRKMRIAAGDGNTADPESAFCAHYPGSGAAKILEEEPLAHVNKVGNALLGRDEPGTYPAHHPVAMRWWNVLNPEQMVAALFGDMATPDQETAAKKMYADLDPETRRLVNMATMEIYGDGDFASVGVWWETLDCRKMRIAAGDGNTANSDSVFCAHYPESGLTTLGDMAKAHVDKVGMALLGRMSPGEYPTKYTIPYFPAYSDMRHGFARVVNRGGREVDVNIVAYDDEGMAQGELTLTIGAHSVAHFNAADIAMGNPDKGLMGSVEAGMGDWRLVLTSTLPLKATGFMRMSDAEFLTSLQATVPYGMTGHLVNIVNPGRNTNQVGWLRIINPGHETAYVTIAGMDDDGMEGASSVEFMVYPGGAKMVSAAMLEAGGEGMTGALEMGMGKWRLRVTSPQHIKVMSLIETPSGYLSNVSVSMNH